MSSCSFYKTVFNFLSEIEFRERKKKMCFEFCYIFLFLFFLFSLFEFWDLYQLSFWIATIWVKFCDESSFLVLLWDLKLFFFATFFGLLGLFGALLNRFCTILGKFWSKQRKTTQKKGGQNLTKFEKLKLRGLILMVKLIRK